MTLVQKECEVLFKEILKRLDDIKERQKDVLDLIDNITKIEKTVWGGFVSQKLLEKELKKMKKEGLKVWLKKLNKNKNK